MCPLKLFKRMLSLFDGFQLGQSAFVIDLSFPKLFVFKVHSRTFFVSGDFVGRFGVVNWPSNV